MKESQLKPRQQQAENFQVEGKPLLNKYEGQEKERNQKEYDCESHNQGYE